MKKLKISFSADKITLNSLQWLRRLQSKGTQQYSSINEVRDVD